MDQLTPETFGDFLGFAAVIGALLIIAYQLFESYCERCPVVDPLTGEIEDQQEIAAEHVVKREPAFQRNALDAMANIPLGELWKRNYGIQNNPSYSPASIGNLPRYATVDMMKRESPYNGTNQALMLKEHAGLNAAPQHKWSPIVDGEIQNKCVIGNFSDLPIVDGSVKFVESVTFYGDPVGGFWDNMRRYATAAESEGGEA